MSRFKDDDKERYLTYSIVVRQADEEKGIKEQVVTKKMAKFIDGGPKEFLDWTYHFFQLAKLKEWGPEDKFHNTKILLEGDLLDAFNHYEASANDGDMRMGDDDFTKALYQASIVVEMLPLRVD
ncbi:hypothetical protein PHYSODRAFT_518448 [Phytophthora sojae]|uniref:Uncharacterized protein n=1 Tax=Phytophthora sojae (strain P6497) TaxID=1094619 RepID=G5A0A5_PHYSP|nr:hypothetical protein PHYSODRAFT_518448 [Phytophthora sojae]EGZ10494.1 hypothetical protein PHYSODRAFT_518448 [Phytophthora sojae]|eukprot:XP_009533239.1 hypothetical protein PHYSODRAFT_518448 [Phytophthora sojae]